MKKEVLVTCEVKERLALSQIKPLQGGLKVLAKERLEKLKKSIKKFGFSFPILVWENQEDGLVHCIDGHQRLLALADMQKEGWFIPQLPIVFINAANVAEAKSKVLAVASQYGKFNENGLVEFLDFDISAEDLVSTFEIPDFDISDFVGAHVLEPEAEEPEKIIVSEHQRSKESNVEANINQVKQVQLFLSQEDHEKFLQQAAFMIQNDNYKNLTEAVVGAMNEKFNRYKK